MHSNEAWILQLNHLEYQAQVRPLAVASQETVFLPEPLVSALTSHNFATYIKNMDIHHHYHQRRRLQHFSAQEIVLLRPQFLIYFFDRKCLFLLFFLLHIMEHLFLHRLHFADAFLPILL